VHEVLIPDAGRTKIKTNMGVIVIHRINLQRHNT
jgi:hypothetical protein